MRAGLWNVEAAIATDFIRGTMLPQIDWALNVAKYAVIVLNPNERVPYLTTAEAHCNFVWENYIKPAQFGRIMILTNGEGCQPLYSIMLKNRETFFKDVRKLALVNA